MRVFLIVAVLFSYAGWVYSAGNEDGFERLFGGEAERVAATQSTTDDAAFAEKLFKASESLKADEVTRRHVLNKAYDFGIANPAGYAVAVKAIRELIGDVQSQKAPDHELKAGESTPEEKRAELQTKLLAVLDLQWKKGKPAERADAGKQLFAGYLTLSDEALHGGHFDDANKTLKRAQEFVGKDRSRKDLVLNKIKRVAAREQASKKAEKLQARLNVTPDDVPLRTELILTRLLELDDPAAAAKTVTATCDEDTRHWVPVIDAGTEKATADELVPAAEWLVKLADAAKGEAKATALTRAAEYLNAFLERYETENAARLSAKQLRTNVARQLEALAPDSAKKVDLLALANPKQGSISGTWEVRDGALVSDASAWAYFELPYTPPAEYDMEVVFTRLSGTYELGPFCYAAGKTFRWVWGVGGGQFSGIIEVGGKVVGSKNPSEISGITIKKDKTYKTVYKIRADGVEVLLDGKSVASYKTNYSDVGDEGRTLKTPQSLGLFSRQSSVRFESVSVTEITGKGRVRTK